MNQAVANPNQTLWEKGDFTEIAGFMRQSGEALIDSLRISPPLEVLDLGCGDGTTAIPLARAGANVTGIDIARNLVEAGNKRASAEGLQRLKFQEGDASHLEEVENETFDLTLSIFGAMFAPRPFDVAEDGARHAARRPHCHGELDSERFDVCVPVAKNQLRIYPSATRRVRQPDDLGPRNTHSRAIWSRGCPFWKHFHGQGHILLRFCRQESGRVHRAVSGFLRPNDECIRCGS